MALYKSAYYYYYCRTGQLFNFSGAERTDDDDEEEEEEDGGEGMRQKREADRTGFVGCRARVGFRA